MGSFQLHERLQQDCHIVGELANSVLLLMDNACYPWFILVPQTQHREFYQLDASLQTQLLQQSNAVARFLKEELRVDKVNIAAIGNLVPQMHIHIIGRRSDDAAWPGVVWGHDAKQEYDAEQSSVLINGIKKFFADAAVPLRVL